jgi:hypothetical protein
MGNPLQYLPINEALYGLLYGIQLPIHPLYLPIYHAQESQPQDAYIPLFKTIGTTPRPIGS